MHSAGSCSEKGDYISRIWHDRCHSSGSSGHTYFKCYGVCELLEVEIIIKVVFYNIILLISLYNLILGYFLIRL